MAKASEDLLDAIDRQEWLTPLAKTVQDLLRKAYKSAGPAGQQIKNVLHGTWLGHPLHPMLTDVPVGAWTATAALDTLEALTGSKQLDRGADAAVVVGLAGALGSAASGITDWGETSGRGRARRIGLLHGLMNISATSLYATSLICRMAGARSAGRRFALLGYTVSAAAGYLGGHLVFGEQIGVNHAPKQALSDEFQPVLPESELPENEPRRVEVEGAHLVLVRQGEHVYAMTDSCTHLGDSLSGGKIVGDSIVCPWHGSRFALEDGRVLDGPATFPEQFFEARINNGQIEVRNATAEPSEGETKKRRARGGKAKTSSTEVAPNGAAVKR